MVDTGDRMIEDQVRDIFAVFRKWSPELTKMVFSCAQYKRIKANATILREGEFCHFLGLMLEGEKRVFKLSESGREITLYENGPGDVCILNTSSILANTRYPAIAVAETDVVMLAVEAECFREMVAKYAEIRAFAFSVIGESLASLVELISEITFRKMDQRLMDYLVEKAEDDRLFTTHQNIANDLGTAREVISRLLKDFERKGLISISRNLIQLTQLPYRYFDSK
jgi:CRP/FNR family transcriptional regulator